MEGSLDRVLFVIELEFLKILVPRLRQNISDVNINVPESQSKCILYMWKASWSTDIS